jgi:2,3-diketo-5-methylthio-1-phosphopentane phosphatase
VTIDLRRRHVFGLLLDIEGTTTPSPFVREVLFPFARAHLRGCIEARRESSEMELAVRELGAERAAHDDRPDGPPAWQSKNLNQTLASAADYAEWLMDHGQSSPGLTRLQGLVWDQGYQAGELRGQVFDDLPSALFKWRAGGNDVAIYSAASELAQRRLFESVADGDLTPFIARYFDTSVGPKTAAGSYERIVAALRCRPAELLFLSDQTVELAAARAAGLQVALSIRPGNQPQPDAGDYDQFTSFDEIVA